MFKNREISVQLKKTPEGGNQEPTNTTEDLDEKADLILHKVERLLLKVGIGIGLYVVLDTGRKVAVAKANQP
jgi:hypothetical protein